MNLNEKLDIIWLMIFIMFFYELLFLFYLMKLRRILKRIEEEELIRDLKKKYKD
jgi:hypothetical protein